MLKMRIQNHFGVKVKFTRSPVIETEHIVRADLPEASVLGLVAQAVSSFATQFDDCFELDDCPVNARVIDYEQQVRVGSFHTAGN